MTAVKLPIKWSHHCADMGAGVCNERARLGQTARRQNFCESSSSMSTQFLAPLGPSVAILPMRRSHEVLVATVSVRGKSRFAKVVVEQREEVLEVERLGQIVNGTGVAESHDLLLGGVGR